MRPCVLCSGRSDKGDFYATHNGLMLKPVDFILNPMDCITKMMENGRFMYQDRRGEQLPEQVSFYIPFILFCSAFPLFCSVFLLFCSVFYCFTPGTTPISTVFLLFLFCFSTVLFLSFLLFYTVFGIKQDGFDRAIRLPENISDPSLIPAVSKNDEFCNENEKLCIKNEELCI